MKIKIAVLFGGKSTEHEVSIITALQAMGKLDKNKYELYPIYIAKNSNFYYNYNNEFFDINNFKNIPELLKRSKKITFIKDGDNVYIREIEKSFIGKKDITNIDIAFPIVHGTNVEDGTLQGYLHMLDIPYVGSDVLSSAVGMDKYIMKKFLKSEGVPVLDGNKYNIVDYKNEDDLVSKIEKTFGYPVVVKPINLGSSIGITIAKNKQELLKSLSVAFSFTEEIVVERAIMNLREINVSVLGNKYECKASICEEPIKKDEILSFANKYLKDNASKNNTKNSKATLDEKTEEYIKKISMDTFRIIGCSGVARVDCMIDVDINEIYVNEINTIPGSLSFYLWENTGMTYEEELDYLIKLALDTFRREKNLSFTFESNLLSNHKLFKNK